MFQPLYFSAFNQHIHSTKIGEPPDYRFLSAQLENFFDLMCQTKATSYFDMLEVVKQKMSIEIDHLNKLFLGTSTQLTKITSTTAISNEHEAILSNIIQFCERVEKLNIFFLEEVNEGLQRVEKNPPVKLLSIDYKKMNFSLIVQKIDILYQKSQRWSKRYANHITHMPQSKEYKMQQYLHNLG
jgi:hypothetical protein